VQSQQLLSSIQSRTVPLPDAILFEPAGSSAHPHVAHAAAAAGIGVALLNHDANYIEELRRLFSVPVFSTTSNHEDIGRIQGQQLSALLPRAETFSTSRPSESLAAQQRYAGVLKTKPEAVQLRVLKAHWTESSATRRSPRGSSFPLRASRGLKPSAPRTTPWRLGAQGLR